MAKLLVEARGPEFPELLPGTGQYQGLELGIPANLRFDAGVMRGDNFEAIPNLAEELNIERWIHFLDLYEDSLWHATGTEPANSSLFVTGSWEFCFLVPTSHVGDTLFIVANLTKQSADYESNCQRDYLKNRTSNCAFTVVAPCSPEDSNRALGTIVVMKALGSQAHQSIEIADSLIALGWEDLAGLQFAALSAHRLGLNTKVLEYIDLNYRSNGRLDALTPMLSPESEEREYRRQRDKVLERIEEQGNSE